VTFVITRAGGQGTSLLEGLLRTWLQLQCRPDRFQGDQHNVNCNKWTIKTSKTSTNDNFW